jgi:2-iminobutanoate/2-iminopropanoate deaminase
MSFLPLAEPIWIWQVYHNSLRHVLRFSSHNMRRDMMQRQGVNSPELAQPVGPFSHLVDTGVSLYLSGQVAQEPTTAKLIEGDVTAQTARILENIQAVFRIVGRDLGHVVKVNVFLTDMADFAEMNAVYARYFDPPYPARSAIAVKALPLGARVEIECVAQ